MLNYLKLQKISVNENHFFKTSLRLKSLLSSYSVNSYFLINSYWFKHSLKFFGSLYKNTFFLVYKHWLSNVGSQPHNPVLTNTIKKPILESTKLLLQGSNFKISKTLPSFSDFRDLHLYSNSRFRNIYKWFLFNMVYLNINLLNPILNSYKNKTFMFYSDFSFVNLVNSEYFRINYVK